MPFNATQMFEHSLTAVKGWWHLYALTKTAKLKASLLEQSTRIPIGRVAHINADGEFELGGGGTKMPIFLRQGNQEPDVYNNGVSPTSQIAHWYGILPEGMVDGLVAVGGYELQTTEYDHDQTYTPNQLLTASNVGVLTNQTATQYEDWICGVTSYHSMEQIEDSAPSGPEGRNAHGVEVLSFWPYFLPAAAA
jgi:hypothetical protein